MIGDGAMTGGVAFEAIHQAGGLGTPIVVVLNDNGMSIAPNVGALSRYFNRVRLNPRFWHAREGVEGRLSQLPGGIGARFERLGPQLKESIKAFWAPGLFWEELDWAYVGRHRRPRRRRRCAARCARRSPPSGRSSSTSRRSRARASRPPRTAAWRAWRSGTPPSPTRSPTARRCRPSPSAVPGRRRSRRRTPRSSATRWSREIQRDRRVVGITAAMNSGTGLDILQKAEPEHYFDVGIAEQQAVLFAAGLALEGAKPVCAIYSTFLQRAFDQIVHDVALQEPERRLRDGPRRPRRRRRPDAPRRVRHRLPALPAEHDADGAARRGDARAHAAHRARDRRPGRPALPARRGRRRRRCRPSREPIEIGTGEILREGRRVALLGYGSGVQKALDAADLLAEQGIDATVADARFAKPLDAALIAQLCAEHELLVTVEEGVLQGGFGSAVWEHCNEHGHPDAADHPRRPARPLRHARQAGAAARRGRLHRRGDRRAGPRRRSPSAARSRPGPDGVGGRGRMARRSTRRSARCSTAEPPPPLELGPADLAELRAGYVRTARELGGAADAGRVGRGRRDRRGPTARRVPVRVYRPDGAGGRRSARSSGTTAAAG